MRCVQIGVVTTLGAGTHPRVVSNNQCDRVPVAESKRVPRARCLLGATRQNHPIVARIAVHGERHGALFDPRVRDERVVDAAERRREPVDEKLSVCVCVCVCVRACTRSRSSAVGTRVRAAVLRTEVGAETLVSKAGAGTVKKTYSNPGTVRHVCVCVCVCSETLVSIPVRVPAAAWAFRRSDLECRAVEPGRVGQTGTVMATGTGRRWVQTAVATVRMGRFGQTRRPSRVSTSRCCRLGCRGRIRKRMCTRACRCTWPLRCWSMPAMRCSPNRRPPRMTRRATGRRCSRRSEFPSGRSRACKQNACRLRGRQP